MKKLTVFAYGGDSDLLVRKLMNARCVDISVSDVPDGGTCGIVRFNCDEQRAELENRLSKINAAMPVLNRYTTRKKSLVKPKIKVDREKFIADGYYDRAWNVVTEVGNILDRKTEIRNEISKLGSLTQTVEPWLAYDMPLDFTGTDSTETILGCLPAGSDLNVIGKELYAAGSIAEKVSDGKNGIFISLICCRSDSEEVMKVLSSHGFVRSSFKGISSTARACTDECERKTANLMKEDEMLENRLKKLAEALSMVEVLCDIDATSLNAAVNKQKMAATESTVILDGWVPAQHEKKVADILEKFDCAYDLDEPGAEDDPPVLLENNGYATNFEWVLGMYSYPGYGKFDPTFIMSIFYFIIFGIMFADAGYGLLLVLGCFGAVKLLKPGEGMKRFLLMFGYCGISSIIFGVLFGAYFGDLPIAIMRNIMGVAEENLPNLALLGTNSANIAVLFDPLQNPMLFLVLSLGVGAVHLIAGMAVKFVLLCKQGQVFDAIFDIGSYWLLFAGIAMLVLVPSVGKWVLIAGVAMIVLTHGRKEKNIVMKFLKGLLGLYDLISYASDLLSYSRILALGLAAGVIAQVVNIIATMGGPTVSGFIVLVIAFIVGHALNLVINVLGTFVHTSRLQYIEFFNKFYEDGGRPFKPALPSDKYTTD